MLQLNNVLYWLVKSSHMTCTIGSKWFTYEYCSYATLKFVYNIDSWFLPSPIGLTFDWKIQFLLVMVASTKSHLPEVPKRFNAWHVFIRRRGRLRLGVIRTYLDPSLRTNYEGGFYWQQETQETNPISQLYQTLRQDRTSIWLRSN